mmetsp:Transcript_25937/g.48691  ORF Transcript_25937/g.48691 Transcript_25937/m.48691 type:complete len:203 (-) Transcript_25937:1109-1717(-)
MPAPRCCCRCSRAKRSLSSDNSTISSVRSSHSRRTVSFSPFTSSLCCCTFSSQRRSSASRRVTSEDLELSSFSFFESSLASLSAWDNFVFTFFMSACTCSDWFKASSLSLRSPSIAACISAFSLSTSSSFLSTPSFRAPISRSSAFTPSTRLALSASKLCTRATSRAKFSARAPSLSRPSSAESSSSCFCSTTARTSPNSRA